MYYLCIPGKKMLLKVKNSVFQLSLWVMQHRNHKKMHLAILPRFCALVTNLSTMDSHAVLSCKGKKMENSPYFIWNSFRWYKEITTFCSQKGRDNFFWVKFCFIDWILMKTKSFKMYIKTKKRKEKWCYLHYTRF